MSEAPIKVIFEPFGSRKVTQEPCQIGRWRVSGIRHFPVEGFVEERHQVGNVPALGIPKGIEVHRREVMIVDERGGFVSPCLASGADCRDVRVGITFLRTDRVVRGEAGIELTMFELK